MEILIRYFTVSLDVADIGRNNPTIDAGIIPCDLTVTFSNIVNVGCKDGANGSLDAVVAGNLGPPTYLWSNGATTSSISNLVAGVYSLTVTDLPCSTISMVTITEPTLSLSLVCSKVDVSTIGGSDGEAVVNASGGTSPYTYLWSNSGTTSTITNLVKGTYTVTVSDANACTSVCSSQVNEPSCNLTATATVTNMPTCANNDGVVNLTVTGVVGAPTYNWSNGATTEDLTGLSAGNYTVTVTEGACTSTATVSLNVIPSNIIYYVCVGDSYNLEITDTNLPNIQWQKNGVDIQGANGTIYIASEVGIYTYTSNGLGGCSVGQCCPVEIQKGANCCPKTICTPVKVTRKN